MTAQPKLKSTQTLPEIVAIVGMRDFGPSDGEGSTCCPHCGASGRYVWHFICADGSRRGAMRGCIQLFPGSKSRYAKLVQEAFDRKAKVEEENRSLSVLAPKRKLASWWQEMIDAAEEFGSAKLPDHDAIQAATLKLNQAIAGAEGRRQDWLRRNGYGRRR